MLDSLLHQVVDWQQYLSTTPVHPLLPFPILDVLGAIRLSIVVDQIARAAALSRKDGKRSSALQEAFGILVVVFGGETFIACCTGTTPSWLLSPAVGLLFAGTLLTRTPLAIFLPKRPSLILELPLSLFDALGRSLLLTSVTLLPLTTKTSSTLPLNPLSSTKLYNNPTAMLLVPFISTTPFPVLIFGWATFTASPTLQTPPELRPGGWMTVDFWAPGVISTLYAFLIHAHSAFLAPYDLVRGVIRHSMAFTAFLMEWFGKEGEELPVWVYGHEPWTPMDASALCCLVLTVLFGLRAVYNFGGRDWITGKAVYEPKHNSKSKAVKDLERKFDEKITSGQSPGVGRAPEQSTPIKKKVA